jgi:hypothetical protein
MKKHIAIGKWKTFTSLGGMLLLCTLMALPGCQKGIVGKNAVSRENFIDVDSLGTRKVYSAKDAKLLEEAISRMDKHIVIKNGLYSLNIENGDVIEVSDRVFNLLKNAMLYTNDQITKGVLVINNGTLMPKVLKDSLPISSKPQVNLKSPGYAKQ